MDFYGSHFEYAGESSRKYGLIIVNIDTERDLRVAGATQSVSIFNKRNNKKYNIGTDHTDSPLTFEMEILSDIPLRGEHRRKIQKWLFNQRDFQRLYLDLTDDIFGETYNLVDGQYLRTYLNCRFTNPEKIEDGSGIIGYRFSVECDSGMAWQDSISKHYDFSDVPARDLKNIVVKLDTDNPDYTYPMVKLGVGASGGDISIINQSDSTERATTFLGLSANIALVLDGEYNYVSGGNYERFANRNFIRLLDGENHLSIAGDVNYIEITWRNARYL